MDRFVEVAKHLARTSPPSAFNEGTQGRFLRINEEWGMKLYEDEEIAQSSYEFQTWGASIGVGPKISTRFQVGDEFGYLTEAVVETYQERWIQDNDTEGKNVDWCSDQAMRTDPEFHRLIEKAKKHGLVILDWIAPNFGYLPNGRLVCIDFGCCEECEQAD